jgi:hypothetical protein
MAEPTSVLTPPEPASADVYRPLSAMAVASLAVAGLYASLLAVLSIVAFATGTPLFLAMWTVVIPAVGLVLAILARLRIRNSEGVLSGEVLTKWAWWLSLLFGLGYIAYYVGAYLAVSNQAETFTTEWLSKVRDGKIAEAFLETQEPAKRKGVNPADPEAMYLRYGIAQGRRRGPMAGFQDQDVIHLIQRAGPDLTVTPLGVKGWDYDKGGYQVAEVYRLTTPEGSFDVDLTVRSSEGPGIEGRKWHMQPAIKLAGPPQLTSLGMTLDRWYAPAHQFVQEWVKKRNDGNIGAAFLDTLPLPQRKPLQQEYQARLILGSFFLGGDWAAAPLSESGLKKYRAGELEPPDATGSTKFIRSEELQALKAEKLPLESEITNRFQDPMAIVLRGPEGRGWWRIISHDQGVVRYFFPVGLVVLEPGKDLSSSARYNCEAALIVESDAGELTAERIPSWRLVGIQLLRGGKPPTPPPGAAGGPEAMAN